jgi:transcriptional regulator with XRE-family HTH domain
MIDITKEFGARLKQEREKVGMQQNELAEKIGVSCPTLSQYESGKRFPRYIVINKICDALGINGNYLVQGTKYEQNNNALIPERNESVVEKDCFANPILQALLDKVCDLDESDIRLLITVADSIKRQHEE